MNPPVTLIYEGTVRTFNLAAGASFIVAGGIPIKTTFRIPLKERLSISEGLTEILPSSDGSYQLYGGRTYDVVVIGDSNQVSEQPFKEAILHSVCSKYGGQRSRKSLQFAGTSSSRHFARWNRGGGQVHQVLKVAFSIRRGDRLV
mmetsp:Transcript_34963/g.56598  ORF Transcript_34963/g.56598 Transcript_34963/m.56598 type:complete len:145 (+) Transcript_34963:2-436(+)